MTSARLIHLSILSICIVACSDDDSSGGITAAGGMAVDPETAPEVAVDRFSAGAGMLFVRDASNGLPEENAPIDFDQPPFITQGLGPAGEMVEYYNFDVQPTEPAPIYVLFEEGASVPVQGQLNIIDVIPGSAGYSDFWHVRKVTVPTGYVANAITSVDEILEHDLPIEAMPTIVNCPVVPDGSTADKRIGGGSPGLVRGWYQDQVVRYFSFEEAPLEVDSAGMVPLSPIYVSFNVNPNEPGGGPASGFVTETGTMQTHNVVATLPGDAGYSPLWGVNVYDNADFGGVSDLVSAQAANILATGVATPNCPIVSVQ